MYPCHNTGGNQEWSVTSLGHIKHHSLCLTLTRFEASAPVVMMPCESEDNVNQMWKPLQGGRIRHSKINYCLDAKLKTLIAQPCNMSESSQQFDFKTV